MSNQFPGSVDELLDLIDELAPEPKVLPGLSSDKIMFDAGRRSLSIQLRELRGRAVAPVVRQARGAGRVSR